MPRASSAGRRLQPVAAAILRFRTVPVESHQCLRHIPSSSRLRPFSTLGFLTLWPAGPARPLVATLNSVDGRSKSNAAIVAAGAEGTVSVYGTNNADVIMDINGYFVSPATSRALAFYPLAPCRVVDTRMGRY